VINVKKQIDYWINGAKSDLETAELLISGSKVIEGLFFCHLCIEKALKAVIVKENRQIPPRTHDLFSLATKAQINLSQKDQEHLQILMKYQLEGRYPEFNPTIPPGEKVIAYLEKTKSLIVKYHNIVYTFKAE
jgi:HEPN domain-containing protein